MMNYYYCSLACAQGEGTREFTSSTYGDSANATMPERESVRGRGEHNVITAACASSTATKVVAGVASVSHSTTARKR